MFKADDCYRVQPRPGRFFFSYAFDSHQLPFSYRRWQLSVSVCSARTINIRKWKGYHRSGGRAAQRWVAPPPGCRRVSNLAPVCVERAFERSTVDETVHDSSIDGLNTTEPWIRAQY
ncbi:hypothetical protein EVAR_29175_1 [Eumeta japonica]|uniref:Uncharacterized protein n=1 Tax=Eumeta variegata TaxID=151549 RepID=A0A4C1VEI0_EUMVA|nr:hypothetical protein EVAR_29175_1 [Eumeta japonica]